MKSNVNNVNALSRCKSSAKTFAVLVASLISLSGCITALVAGAAIATVDILHDRRSAGEYVDDSTIELTAKNFLVSKPDIRAAAHIKVDSWNGILLITGEIDSEDMRQKIVQKLSNIDGVRQLVDESTITGKTALLARTNDAWITSKVKSKLVYKTGMDANRVKVITTRGSVYLMGIVTQEEGDRATDLARKTKGVARVVKVFEYQDEITE